MWPANTLTARVLTRSRCTGEGREKSGQSEKVNTTQHTCVGGVADERQAGHLAQAVLPCLCVDDPVGEAGVLQRQRVLQQQESRNESRLTCRGFVQPVSAFCGVKTKSGFGTCDSGLWQSASDALRTTPVVFS